MTDNRRWLAQKKDLGDAVRFGFVLDDHILIPETMRSEYLSQAPIFPVPRAPRRLAGLIHLRGHAVIALDLSESAPTRLPVIGNRNALVLGEGSDAIGLICDAAPQRVNDLQVPVSPDEAGEWPAPTPWLAAVLTGPRRSGDDGQWWWEMDLDALVEISLHRAESDGPQQYGPQPDGPQADRATPDDLLAQARSQ